MYLNEMKVIRFHELTKKIGLSRSTVFRLEKSGKFPRHIQLGQKSIGWILSDIENWISGRTSKIGENHG